MLVKLLDKDVRVNWELIKHVVESTITLHMHNGEVKEHVYTEVYDRLLENKMHAWAFFKEDHLYGLVLTGFREGNLVGVRELVVLAVYGVQELTQQDWVEGYKQLREFAKVSGCGQISAYTDIDGIARKAKELGAKTRTFILLEV